jgi:hypothetical protein
MQTSNSLGFVVWGVKNGFQNNLFSHNLSDSIRTTLIDIQELCMSQYSDFYAIERIGRDTLVSLYDPTVMDYSGSRKAYIVFSIIFPSGAVPSASVLQLLASFKNYYKVESAGLPSQEIFLRKLLEFNTTASTNSNATVGTQMGFKNYASFDEIKEVFTDLDILDYRKIYFFDRPNAYVSSNPNFVAVTSLVRKYKVEMQNYIGQDYQILINGITLNSSQIKQLAPGIIEINDLNKTDKIEIRRGGSSQAFESFYARDKQHVLLPVPKVDHPKQFIIENFDPSRYLVKVNNREMQASFINGNSVSVAISAEFVLVEIIDRQTSAVVQSHNTSTNKTDKMVFNGANSRAHGTSGPATGVLGGNVGGVNLGGSEKPKKESKKGLFVMVFVLLLFGGFGITGWQLGWFSENVPPILTGNGTSTTETNPTAETNPTPDPKDQPPNNPTGYTVKPGSEEILTEKGLLKKSTKRFYRYFNDKWSFSEENTPLNWKDLKDKEKPSILKEYFTKNSPEENVKIEAAKKKAADAKAAADTKADADAAKAAADAAKAAAAAKAIADAKAEADAKVEEEKKDKCKTICDKLSACLNDNTTSKNNKKIWDKKVNDILKEYNNNNCDCPAVISKINNKRAGL